MKAVALLFDDTVDRLHLVEVSHQSLALFDNVRVDGFGNLEMLALDIDLHGTSFHCFGADRGFAVGIDKPLCASAVGTTTPADTR